MHITQGKTRFPSPVGINAQSEPSRLTSGQSDPRLPPAFDTYRNHHPIRKHSTPCTITTIYIYTRRARREHAHASLRCHTRGTVSAVRPSWTQEDSERTLMSVSAQSYSYRRSFPPLLARFLVCLLALSGQSRSVGSGVALIFLIACFPSLVSVDNSRPVVAAPEYGCIAAPA